MRATTVLWDIDGTLLHSGGVAPEAFLDAVAEVTGARPTPEGRDYGGRLDSEIAQMLLTGAARPLRSSAAARTLADLGIRAGRGAGPRPRQDLARFGRVTVRSGKNLEFIFPNGRGVPA
jgi:beta-phosphoglucomutase-like phosphatase (HAD superfamily)